MAVKEKTHKGHWIFGLISEGFVPVMEILDVVPDNESDFWEREYIQNFRERGFSLTNFSDGGESPMRGKKHTPEALAKMSRSHSGEKHYAFGKSLSAEHRAALSAAAIGRKHSDASRAKMSLQRMGNKSNAVRTLSPEHRANISAGGKGKKRSVETREKIRAWHLGKKLVEGKLV